jgi:hypothetical protein
MTILNRFLGKLGVDYSGLNAEEKATFNAWRDALAGRKLTDEDVKNFLDLEYHESVVKLSATDNSKELDLFLKMKVDFIIKTKDFLASPEKEKQMVENQIQQQIK